MQLAPETQTFSGAVPSEEPKVSWTQLADRVAIVLSGLCAVHCAATPLVLAVLPFLGTSAVENGIRITLASLGIVVIGMGAVLHRSVRSLPYLVVALSLLGWLALNPGVVWFEEWLAVLASLVLMVGHWTNLKTAKACARHAH
jgi:MerC mercury resistance protein